MENKENYVCSNCRKQVEFIAEDSALCQTCKTNLPTAKFNSRIKEKAE